MSPWPVYGSGSVGSPHVRTPGSESGPDVCRPAAVLTLQLVEGGAGPTELGQHRRATPGVRSSAELGARDALGSTPPSFRPSSLPAPGFRASSLPAPGSANIGGCPAPRPMWGGSSNASGVLSPQSPPRGGNLSDISFPLEPSQQRALARATPKGRRRNAPQQQLR